MAPGTAVLVPLYGGWPKYEEFGVDVRCFMVGEGRGLC